MKQYYGIPYVADGIETIAIIPLGMEGKYQTGFYNFVTDELVLESKDRVQNLKVFQKMDLLGRLETNNKNQPLYERRMVEENVTFRLIGEALRFFLGNFVENEVDCLGKIAEAREGYLKRVEAAKTPEAETLSITNSIKEPVL